MKKQSQNRVNLLSREQVENLTETGKETLAIGFSGHKTFSTVDLWNIQRRGRTMLQRRYID